MWMSNLLSNGKHSISNSNSVMVQHRLNYFVHTTQFSSWWML